MISCINPSYISSNHTINTLRYSDRLKEQTAYMQKQINNNKVKINSNAYNNYNSNDTQQQPHQHQQKNSNNNNSDNDKLDREKELEEINMNVFSAKDDILNDINFDERINLEDDLIEFKKLENPKNSEISKKQNNNDNKMVTPEKNMDNNSEKIIDEEMEDLIYLKKTVSKDGKFISDDFIKYHKLTDKIIQDEDDIITTHMEVIKQDAKLLTEEGKLISLIKGIGTEDEKIEVDEYINSLENILDKKINLYSELQDKIDIYKEHLKEEDKMRKEHPQFFVDPADL
jgi:kinesin family protein 2/24